MDWGQLLQTYVRNLIIGLLELAIWLQLWIQHWLKNSEHCGSWVDNKGHATEITGNMLNRRHAKLICVSNKVQNRNLNGIVASKNMLMGNCTAKLNGSGVGNTRLQNNDNPSL